MFMLAVPTSFLAPWFASEFDG